VDLVAAAPGIAPLAADRMSSRSLLNVGMVFAAMLVAVILHMYRPSEEAPKAHALVPISPNELRSIAIERVNSPVIRLQREDAQWHMTAPVKARLDETALARLLDLSRLGANNKFTADDLAKYGLDQPWARVRFGTHTLEFGNTNTVTEEFYVRSGDAIYAVPARNANAIPSTPGKLIAHRMFTPEEAIAAIEMPAFSLRHDGTRWQMNPPDPGLSQDDLVRWIELWRYASSVITQPGEAVASTDATITLRDGRKVDLGVKARSPDLVLHRRDEGLDYHFNARMAPLLLASPSAAANQTR